MIEFLKRNRLLRIFVGGTAIVGAGAATGVAVAGNDTAPPPKKVPLGSTKLDVEGQDVQVPPSTELPQDVLDQPNANAAADSPASPNSAVNNSTAAGVNTTANTAHVNTTANSANTAEHQGEAPHHEGNDGAPTGGGDHGDGGHDGGGGGHDGGGDGGHGGGGGGD
jgi:hypothetical protein